MKTLETYIPESSPLLSNAKQQKVREAYNSQAIPTKKLEDWKFFDTSPWFDSSWDFSPNSSLSKETVTKIIKDLNYDNLLVFDNGILAKDYSDLTNCSVAEQTKETIQNLYDYTNVSEYGKLESLNTLCAKDGAFISIDKNSEKKHILIVSYFSGKSSFTFQRNIIAINSNSNINITEIIVSEGESCINNAIEVLIAENSQCEYTSIQKINDKSQFTQSFVAKQEKNSQLTCSTFPLSGKYVRTNIWVDKNDEQAHTYLNGLFFPAQDEQFEIYAWSNHNKPKCETHELFKGLAKDNGQGVFSGKIYVAKDAQETLATQSNKNILLSKAAKIHSKPQLEIYADDVSCTHGSTTGQINSEALWYMQARGIKREKAIGLLLSGFIAEVAEKITETTVQDYLLEFVNERI